MVSDPVLIPAIISLAFSGVIGIISQLQHSSCVSIRGWGCECIRKVPDPEGETSEMVGENETLTIEARVAEPRQILN
jgi:hypothetical protein